MKITFKVTVITLLSLIGVENIQAQIATNDYPYNAFQDSDPKSPIDSTASSVIQGGLGFGYMMKGGFLGIKCKYVSRVGWGTSLDFRFGASKTRDLPSDYTPLFYPMDDRTVVSINIVKVLTGHGQNPRFSVEVGPSLVRINNAIIIPNPDYDPSSIWHLSKYFKSWEIRKALGFSINMETEILLTTFMIIDISVFANLNSATSILGIGLYFNFGDVND